MKKHTPVMLEQVIKALEIKKNGCYLDLTLGRAGHASAILKKLSSGFLVAFDKDIEAINDSYKTLSKISQNFLLFHKDFKDVCEVIKDLKIQQFDGILLDLGVSSPQLDNANRGFSYKQDANLDMRMNQNQNLDAHFVVNNYSFAKLFQILRNFGQIKNASQYAKIIIKNRPISSTLELVSVLKNNLPAFIVRKKNPAKAVFQAIRIEVNNELLHLNFFLKNSLSLLKPKGVLVVLTFHSLEDKIVKNFFLKQIQNQDNYRRPDVLKMHFSASKKNPSSQEILNNRRAKSARMRVLKKLF